MRFSSWLFGVMLCSFVSAAHAENAAEVMDRLADKYCRDAGGNYEKSRLLIATKGLKDEFQSDVDAAIISITEGDNQFLLNTVRPPQPAKLLEKCELLTAYDVGIEAIASKMRARNLPTRTVRDGKTTIDFMLSADDRAVSAKSISFKPNEGMSISYIRFPASQRPEFVGGREMGSPLEQERLRDSAIRSMKCRVGAESVEVQVLDGKGLFGSAPMEDLETEKNEVAFKAQGSVFYFDFARKSGRRSTPSGTQKIDCF